MKNTIDQSISIFPFEAEWFNSRGLDTFYTGHPFIERNYDTGDKTNFLKKHNILPTVFYSSYKGHIIDYIYQLDASLFSDILIYGGDGTFNVSQKAAFGGSTRRGQWKDLGNGQVELIYDDGGFVRSGDGGSANVDARATITLLSKSKFQLGSTVYRRY